jgi:hypothetical protein
MTRVQQIIQILCLNPFPVNQLLEAIFILIKSSGRQIVAYLKN